MILWPMRMLLPLAGAPDAGLSLLGAVVGLVMCLTDMAFIWAGANWGAVYALRVGQMAMAAMLMAGRMLLMAGYVLLCGLACGLVLTWLGSGLGLLLALGSSAAGRGTALLVVAISTLPILAWFTWRVLLIMPLKASLREFTYFDWLAFDDYRPEPWRGWDFFRERGDRV